MGHLVGNQGMSYTISNLTKVAIWSLKSFRIHPHLAEKSTTLLFHGTFGHPVEENTAGHLLAAECWPLDGSFPHLYLILHRHPMKDAGPCKLILT